MKNLHPRGQTAVAALALAIGAGALGCGKQNGLARLPVFGQVVRADGQKIEGSIIFRPVAGNSGPAVTASIDGGSYRFTKDNGPVAGRYQVVVKPALKKDHLLSGKPSGAGRAPAPGAASKTERTLTADVPAEGPYQFDFKLE